MLKNLIFFGSPEFSAEILESILSSKNVNVVAVVTTQDKHVGRNQILTPSPVATLAQKYDLPCYKPAMLDEANLSHLKLLKPDIFLVVSFGKLVPETWLNTPTIGTYNIHFSLLPKYRGALCISEAIKNQDDSTGVTLMEMDKDLDHGAIIAQESVAIDTNDNVSDLTTKLTQSAKNLLERNLPEICSGNYPKTAQDESLATYTKSHRTATRNTSFIPYENIANASESKASEIHALIRSLNPEPGAWTTINGLDIKIIRSSLFEGNLQIDQVQMTGKKPISWKQFLSGHKI